MVGAVRLALFGLALTLIAAALAAEPLYVPGVALLLLGGGAAAWVLIATDGLLVTRTLTTGTVQEDQPVTAGLKVSSSRLPIRTGTLEDPLLHGGVPLGAHRRDGEIPVHATFPRRGRHTLAPPRVVVSDPFGLAVRAVTGTEDEVLVLPKIMPVTRAGSGGTGDALGHRAAHSRVAAEVELDGLRPLRSGTSAARISWASLARTGELMERHMRPDGDDRPVVVLDTRPADDDTTGEHLDAAVRAAASLCVHLADQGGCSLLLPGDRHPIVVEPGLKGWPRLHVRLALVGPGGTPAAGALTGRQGVIVYVSARPLQRAPRTLTHATGRGRVLVVPEAMTDRSAVFAVAGCLGYDLDARTVRRSGGLVEVARPEQAA